MVELNLLFHLNSRFLKQNRFAAVYIAIIPISARNALKRHSLFGLHDKYECVYFICIYKQNYSHTKYNRSSPSSGMSLTTT